MATFQLLPDQIRDVIYDTETGLRVNVFYLEEEPFTPAAGEIHMFGDDHGSLIAFETVSVTSVTAEGLARAITWYADRLDYPQMEVTPLDPRPVVN